MTATLGVLAGSSQFTETQLRLPGGTVTNSVLSTPDHTSLAVTDFEVQWFGSIDDPTTTDVALISQWAPNADRSWSLRWAYIGGVGQFKLWHSINGTTSVSPADGSFPFTLTAGRFFGVRATRQASTGTVKVYTATGDVDPVQSWTLRGTATAATGTPFNAATPVTIGGLGTATAGVTSNHVVGWFRRALVRNGYDGAGTIVGLPNVTAEPDVATSFTDTAGRLWSLGGATDLITRPLAMAA